MVKTLLQTKAGTHWERIGPYSHNGINTPLFSLRSHESSGIGEYLDLFLLIDFLKSVGFDTLQLLPLNDSGSDPSPYNLLSTKALHPIYLRLQTLPFMEKHEDLLQEIKELKRFNKTTRVHYHDVLAAKEKITREYFKREGALILKNGAFKEFQENNPWLLKYAEFKGLKRHFRGKDSRNWVEGYAVTEQELHYHMAIQFFCYTQMIAVKAYADTNGIFVMGDLPILVSHDSVDVWSTPGLFAKGIVAGAPPDQYNLDGQNWGFPVYKFDKIKKDHFHFWTERLEASSCLYHIFRIDHIVGLFRIFAIPEGDPTSKGHFYPRESEEWIPHGRETLEMMLSATPMLPIGEDLGTVPKTVRHVMHQLGVAGTKVIRWERKWDEEGAFIPFSEYPIDSLTTVSTHDSETLKLWWEQEPIEAAEFALFMGWEPSRHLSKEHLEMILAASHKTPSLFHVNLLEEYLSLFHDLHSSNLANDRINIPGMVSPLNWSFRYAPYLEEIIEHAALKKIMRGFL